MNTVCGVGINDSDYLVYRYAMVDGKSKIVWRCPFYQAWSCMINRAYNKKYQNSKPTYAACSVDPAWHSFMDFRAWMMTQDWEGKQLDKDIICPGNKVYGPDKCVFVSRELNMFTTDSGAIRGELPIGVYWHVRDKKFLSRCCNPLTRKQETIGYFDDPAEAHKAWRAKKHEHACRYADMQTNPRIAAALKSRYLNGVTP